MTPNNDAFVDIGGLRAFAADKSRKTGAGKRAGCRKYLRALRRAMEDIRRTAKNMSADNDRFSPLPREAEWLLDNLFAAERCAAGAAEELKCAKKLPSGDGKTPAAAVLAGALAASGMGSVTKERIGVFLAGAQEARALKEREISLFLSFLSAETLFFLRDACALRGDEAVCLFENVFASLRFLESPEAGEAVKDAGSMDKILALDPTGEYMSMTSKTRGHYRCRLACLADKAGTEEAKAAETVLELARKNGRHVGHYIFTEPLGKKQKAGTGAGYIALNTVPAVISALAAAVVFRNAAVFFLVLLPISEIVRRMTDAALTRIFPPRFVPEMELEGGVPDRAKTVVCQCVLADGAGAVSETAGSLEGAMLRNRDAGKNVIYAALADLPEGERDTQTCDAEILSRAESVFGELNAKYGGGFVFLCRNRRYSKSDNVWRGWERKRGAVLELSRLLNGEKSGIAAVAGDEKSIIGAKYIILLDGDTGLTAGAVKRLVGAAEHPLNRAVVDEKRGVVVSGHGVIRPRTETSLSAANKSDFTRIVSGVGGIDPYENAVSDVYQDVFGLGSFTGKGIIDAAAYNLCLSEAFPEERILSHDLLEGAYLRCCCKSDVLLTDGEPYKVSSWFSRLERWVRGDFQALPRAFQYVADGRGKRIKNPLSLLDRWKIIDNIRRALVPPAELLCLFAAFFVPPLLPAGLAAALSIFGGLLISGAKEAFKGLGERRERHKTTVISGVAGYVMRSLGRLALLPFEGWTCFGAGARAAWRMLVSRKKLLDWVTAAGAEKRGSDGFLSLYLLMWPQVLFGFSAALLSPCVIGRALGLLWLFAPVFARSVSRERKRGRPLTKKEKGELLAYAADMRKYFAEISEEDSFLPPDNRQTDPPAGTARRTSPTNIGLGLLSSIAAFDLKLIDRQRLVSEAGAMLSSVLKMEKHRGHLFNWYDTGTLEPLRPLSVSSVDSGNLAACLITAGEAFSEIGEPELVGLCFDISDAMDFSWLYDKKRRLFHLGWDGERDELSEGHYDLLESEARILSYLAVSRGDVPA
ncbi:MAG: hypothetical protein IKR21_00215, partial [Oscillospiraceae bacterium]|nr:hypothetical protein [Oscillospiraceae bacterium]